MPVFRLKGSLVAGALAAIGASVCCVGLLVLLTLVFLGLAFRGLYLQPQVCEPGAACAEPVVRKRQRLVFWIVAAYDFRTRAVRCPGDSHRSLWACLHSRQHRRTAIKG